jgi:hypothetical protein
MKVTLFTREGFVSTLINNIVIAGALFIWILIRVKVYGASFTL